MLPISELLDHSYIYKNLSVDETGFNVKADSAELYHMHLGNTNSTAVYVKFYNTNVTPVVGTDVPVLTYLLPASSAYGEELVDPAWFDIGLSIACTLNAADDDATSPGSGIIVDLLYK